CAANRGMLAILTSMVRFLAVALPLLFAQRVMKRLAQSRADRHRRLELDADLGLALQLQLGLPYRRVFEGPFPGGLHRRSLSDTQVIADEADESQFYIQQRSELLDKLLDHGVVDVAIGIARLQDPLHASDPRRRGRLCCAILLRLLLVLFY